jgi:hypothetical protein
MKNMKNRPKLFGIPWGSSIMLILIFLLNVIYFQSYAQMTITSGTTVRIVAGGSLNSSENMQINSGGALNVEGTLILKKNLQNSNAAANSVGTGGIQFTGTAAQAITGKNIMQNMTLNNANGLSISNETRVNGVLTLTSGRVTLGGFNLFLGPAATIAGAPSAANMVVATGAGQLQKSFSSAGTFLFPVGDATGTAEYSPVTLAFNSGTFGLNNYAGVNVVDAQFPGTATSYITRYWNVSQSGITAISCNATFQYLLTDVVGTEADIFLTKVDAVPFVAYNASNVALHTIDAHGLAAFGTFTGNLGDGAVPPGVRSLQDKIISAGMVKCADATQTLLIAGNGTNYWVQNGGSVTHIAGSKILYFPGTRVDAGGYLHGYISTTYCSPYTHPAPPAVMAGFGEQNSMTDQKSGMFKIYPNPTPGKFTLELKGDLDPSQVQVEIFGTLGERLQSKETVKSRKQEFSLSEMPTGVYMIHVSSSTKTETQKIIKQ